MKGHEPAVLTIPRLALGLHPSPTLLINGVDVMGMCVSGGRACRLDLPTEDRVLTALGTAAH
jgi:hypothetical protein